MPDFCPQAFINFLCLLGWSPKDDRELLTREELTDAVLARRRQPHQRGGELHGRRPVRSEGGLAERGAHPRAAGEELSAQLLPFVEQAGLPASREKVLAVTPLIRERIKLLREASARPISSSWTSLRPTIRPN